MEIAIVIVVIFAVIKLNGSINQLLGMATSKLDVLEVKSTHDDAKALKKVQSKVDEMGDIPSASELMAQLRGKKSKPAKTD